MLKKRIFLVGTRDLWILYVFCVVLIAKLCNISVRSGSLFGSLMTHVCCLVLNAKLCVMSVRSGSLFGSLMCVVLC